MSRNQCISALGGWEGYRVGTVERFDAGVKGDRAQVWIELLPHVGLPMRCSGCGRFQSSVHEAGERWVRDLPIFDAETHLLIHRRRVACLRCGPKVERLDWLDRYARVTRRLAESVARLCAVLPIKHVADFYGLGWDQVKAIDKAYLESTLGPIELAGVEIIAMDEFALHKGHRYATVVVEPSVKRVLWVGCGRSREEIRPFFNLLGEDGCQRLKAVAMDMNASYELEVQKHCPQAAIVYDLFHVVAKYGREVIDRVRVDEANRLRKDKAARRVVKSARWLLLRNRSNLKRRQDRIRLNELLRANRRLMTVYVLRDDLKHLWEYRYPGAAERFWKEWYSRALRSRIPALKHFAKRLRAYLPGILAHCHYPLSTSLLEGMNNRIKVIKRMAYGYRDEAYFFLKIRAAFPGIAG